MNSKMGLWEQKNFDNGVWGGGKHFLTGKNARDPVHVPVNFEHSYIGIDLSQ